MAVVLEAKPSPLLVFINKVLLAATALPDLHIHCGNFFFPAQQSPVTKTEIIQPNKQSVC